MPDDNSLSFESPAGTALPAIHSDTPSQATDDTSTSAPRQTPTSEPINVGLSTTADEDTNISNSSRGSSSLASAPTTEDRGLLLDRARAFLTSPQLRHEEPSAKRRFLAEKGLNTVEIEGLMRELPAHLPSVPPRTYPHPPPSNLPHLLMGIARLFTWLTGGSTVLILIYYKFLLPRLTRSALARRSLKQHQASLLSRVNESLRSLKEHQAKTFEVLPVPESNYESMDFKNIRILADLLLKVDGEGDAAISDVPPFTVLRCALEEFDTNGKKPTREELFDLFEGRIPWLKTEEGADYETSLWEVLNSNACFSSSPSTENPNSLLWSYTPPVPPELTPLRSSLNSLSSALAQVPRRPENVNPYQGTLDALADVTGYITTQTYQLTTRSSMRFPGAASFGLNNSTLSPQEEEVRREIRSLKGLVLNRKTFAPVRPPAVPTP